MKQYKKAEALFAQEHVIVLNHRLIGDFNNAKGVAEAIGEKLGFPVVVRDIRSRSRILDAGLRSILGIVRNSQNAAMKQFLFHLFFRDADGLGLDPTTSFVVSTLGAGEAPNAFYSAATGAIGVHLGHPKRMPHEAFDLVIAHQGHEATDSEIALPISPSQIRLRSFQFNKSRSSLLVAIGGNADDAQFPDQFWPDLVERAMEVARLLGQQYSVTTSPRTGSSLEGLIETRIRQLDFQPHQLVMYGRGERASLEELLRPARLAIISAESVSMISAALASGARVAAAYWQQLPESPRISSFLREQTAAGRLALWDLSENAAPSFDDLVPMEECWSDALWRSLCVVVAKRQRNSQ